jgi:integrase/recombinase XerD
MSITPVDFDIARTGTRQARISKESRASDARPASDLVQWFLDYYWIRHPISEASIAAYRTDLLMLELWLLTFRKTTLLAAGAKDLRAFLDSHYRSDGRPTGEIPSVSCIKRFFFYLVEVGLRNDDPTEHLHVRIPRRAKRDLASISG